MSSAGGCCRRLMTVEMGADILRVARHPEHGEGLWGMSLGAAWTLVGSGFFPRKRAGPGQFRGRGHRAKILVDCTFSVREVSINC